MESQINTIINLALDIGGTLTKVGITSNHHITPLIFNEAQNNIDHLQIGNKSDQNAESSVFYFQTFSKFESFMEFLKQKILKNCQVLNIVATGGGALKYQSFFNDLKDTIQNPKIHYEIALNQFEALVPALNMFLKDENKLIFKQGSSAKENLLIKNLSHENKEKEHLKVPLLLANIGSGIVGGSALAGGFFVGVQKLINPEFSYDSFSKNPKEALPEELKMMQSCIENLSQLISLYSDIFKIDTILITGGITEAELIRSTFFDSLKGKNVRFTSISSHLAVTGLLLNSKKSQMKSK